MRVIVAGEYRLYRAPDGNYYAESVFGYSFWTRYLEVFDEVLVVARVGEADHVDRMLRVNGDRVAVYPLPYYQGLAGYIRKRANIYAALRALAVDEAPGVIILRVPGQIGTAFHRVLKGRRTYGVEVVGDPEQVFSAGVVDHPLRRLIRWQASRGLRRQTKEAAAVSYVSGYLLPSKYPAGASSKTYVYSSASMPPAAYAAKPRTFGKPLRKVVAIGSMDQTYKGFDVLLRALVQIRRVVPDVRLTIVGGGRLQPELLSLSRQLAIADTVTFTGPLPTAEDVRRVLDLSELFVSSSRTEGLPRTVIEAQARGLACVGTNVGGTPELLPAAALFPSNDEGALAEAVIGLLNDPRKASKNALHGWSSSFEYSAEALQRRRNAMFTHLREASI